MCFVPKIKRGEKKAPKTKKQGNRMTCYMFDETETQFFVASRLTSKPFTKGLREASNRREFGMNDLSMAGGSRLVLASETRIIISLSLLKLHILSNEAPKNYTYFKSNNNLKMPRSPPITLPDT